MAKEPRLSALSFFRQIPNTIVKTLLTSTEWNLYNSILSQENSKHRHLGDYLMPFRLYCILAKNNRMKVKLHCILKM